MKAYDIVQRARNIDRLSAGEVIAGLCSDFFECHGDRQGGDDAAIIGGVGLFNDQPLTLIGIQKGRTTQENLERNFGSSGPSGYRKAQRLMWQAEKFQRPVVTLINTPGASATPQAEAEGIGEAIASTLKVMSQLTVPTLAIILGEGGSGGAIALALADQVWMLEDSVYSILSPEGFASILWKDASLAAKASELMKLTAPELLDLGVIDRIIPEYHGEDPLKKEEILYLLRHFIQVTLEELKNQPIDRRLEVRYQRFRRY